MSKQTIPVPSGQSKHIPETGRRAWVRFATNHEVCCQPMPASTVCETETGWLGRLRDICPGGLALLMRRRFEPGTLLIIELSYQAEKRACSFRVKVLRATPEGKRRWIIGCEFLSPLSQQELRTLRRPEW
jgi:hypothetical protein